jgi:short-subunit dehydrogenase
MPLYRTALITGASSGIGQALAETLAAPGVTLHLSGRNAERLDAVAATCRQRGATVDARVLDVRDAAAMADWIGHAAPLDLVVANAGIGAGSAHGDLEDPAQIRAVFGVNLDGVLNTVLPALAVMRAQPAGADGMRGRIAVIASIAAFVAAPGAASYCASKAAIDTWTVAAARNARAQGVQLTSVCPGYIRTAMTAGNRFPMPGLMDADRAARIILRGLAAGRIRLAFPWWMGFTARIAGLLPPRVLGSLLATQPAKASLATTQGDPSG